MSAAAEGEYGGGIGGKFRKRPFRRPPATPYDRPPAAARGIRGNVAEGAAAAAGRNGWLSKLVDPASRVITRGATRFFASFFQKRLGAPPPTETPVGNLAPRQDVPDLVNTNTLPEIHDQGNKDHNNSRNNSDDGISELEQLLKQKTFTRAEFDQLTELLRSRTVELSEDANKGIEPRTTVPAGDYKKKEVEIVSGQENGIESSKFGKIISTPAVTLKTPGEELASPAEVAKAYMGSRPLRMPVSSLSLHKQTIREGTASPSFVGFAPKSSAEPVGSKSVNRLSGIPGYSENGYITPRPRGRSAIYKMSRSPYFKGQPMITLKGSELYDGYSGPSTSSQWASTNLAHSGGTQGQKRRSSVLESDIGSFGPIRRIRQKSNLASPSKDTTSHFPGKFLPSTTNVLDNVQTSSFPVQMPISLHEPKDDILHLKAAENEERSSYVSVPPQSREMARKILQQLDKLVPSPKEKSSEVKTISSHDSPPKLTLGMLQGQALKSVSEIDSSRIFNVETNGKLDGLDFSCPGSSIAPKQKKIEENGPSKPMTSGTKLSSEAKLVDNVPVSVADRMTVKTTLDSISPSSAAGPPKKRPAFTMQAPEDLLELEDDGNGSTDVFGPSVSGKDKAEVSVCEHKVAISETAVTKKPFSFSSESKPISDFTLNKEAGKEVTDRRAAADEDTGFTFQVVSPQSHPPLTPTMPSPAVEKSATSSEQVTVPTFTFSSKATPLTCSSSMATLTESSSLKFGAKPESKGQLFGSTTTATVTTSVESQSGKADGTHKPGDLFKSVGTTSASGLMTSTTSNTLSFVASTTSSQSNGASTSSMFSIPAAPATFLSGSSADAIVSASSTSTSALSSSASITSSTVPAVVSFQFGSSSSASTGLLSSSVKFGSTDVGPKSVKESPFGMVNSPAVTTSSMCNNIFGFAASASSSASSTSGSIFGTQATQSGNGTSPLTQSMMSQFGQSASPAFGLVGSSLGFDSSAFGSLTSSAKPFGSGSTTSSLTVAASCSAPSSSSFAPSVTSPILFGSSSQAGTSSIFGSVFGTSSPPSTMFTSAASSTASGTSLFGSSSSSPLTFPSSAATTSSTFIFTQATTPTAPVLPFTSFGATAASASRSPAVPAFGMPTPTVTLASGSPGNDQMNIEDSMADDTVQSAMPSTPNFGQQSNTPASNLPFSSPATPSGPPVFQFTSSQSSPFQQTHFQATGNSELGGGFSMGSGGGDKSGRRFIKARRDKHRKK